jgi:hypothetical protein
MVRSSTGLEWLLAHVDRPDGECLIWPFTRDKGDGRARLGDKLAHRVMCELVNGPAPTDKPQAAHSCGNGHLGCVHPRHLSWATNSENQYQRYEHGRASFHRQGNRSRLTPEQIETMRSQYGEFTQEKLAEMYGVRRQTIQYYLKYRETLGHDGGKVKHWSPEEDDRLKQAIARGLNIRQAAEFVGRPHKATMSHIYRIGLTSGQPLSRPRAAEEGKIHV